jgi:Pro-kumamolisin, activation domain/Bacterial Ig-like domain (group 3)/Subtilase family
MKRYVCVQGLALAILLFVLAGLTSAQTSNAQRRITQAVDDRNLVVLKGNTHPFARPAFDRGAAPGSLPMNRMLLVLRHSPEQEAAIKDLLAEQQNQQSPKFHQWLTPQQYGEMFGPSDDDIRSVASWLTSHGFEVSRVANSHHVIEFSGTAAQVQSAFHTSIHHYQVRGKDHWANAADPQIPAALAGVVSGVRSLHNFAPRPMNHFAGTFRRIKDTGKIMKLNGGPQFTFPAGCTGDDCFWGLGPTDFATIYNLSPLWKAGIDGTGQSLAIVQRSNIDVQDVRNFRKLFGLPQNDPEIILDGPDPGLTPDEGEAIIDVEWSGAVAKGAKVKLVVSAITNTTDGVDLSALYIVDNNVAPVLSESFGQCEAFLGTAGNQFYNSLWQQAAAEGITAFVSTGDGSAAGCEDFNTSTETTTGLAVSGLASTPYNVAVGGTDLLALLNPTKYFSLTNDPKTQASALSYVPEIPWNDTCTNPIFALFGFSADPLTNCNDPALQGIGIAGGSGGVSSCTVSDGENLSSCSGGYAKPSWQTGAGVPNDGKRDIPDVSLFAGNGFLGAFYIFCEADINPTPSCDVDPPYTDFEGAGGTSFASPNFAGIMALVNQKTKSRQGNANFVFYKLAAEENLANCNSTGASLPASSCIFNDTTTGTIRTPCTPKSPDCTTEGQNLAVGILTGYDSTVGYDVTTGLGTVNIANLVNNWKSVTFTPTTTRLNVHPSVIVHGQGVGIDIDVDAKSGTPTGQVALLTNGKNPAGDFTLRANGRVDTTTNLLPGGVSNVTARYGGDPTYARSDSNSETVIVLPETSKSTISFFTGDVFGPTPPFSSGPYGSPVFLRVDVNGHSGFGVATGKVILTQNNQGVPGGPFTLNSQGDTLTPNPTTTYSVGAHTVRATYLGDASFLPSIAQPMTFVITKAPTKTTLTAKPTTAVKHALVTLSASIATQSLGNQPLGTVTFFAGRTPLGPPVPVAGATDPSSGLVSATASLSASNLPVGTDKVTAVYSGDPNYQTSTSTAVTITITAH